MRENDIRERAFAMPLTMMTSAASVIGKKIARTFVRESAKIAIADLLGPFQGRLAARDVLNVVSGTASGVFNGDASVFLLTGLHYAHA